MSNELDKENQDLKEFKLFLESQGYDFDDDQLWMEDCLHEETWRSIMDLFENRQAHNKDKRIEEIKRENESLYETLKILRDNFPEVKEALHRASKLEPPKEGN